MSRLAPSDYYLVRFVKTVDTGGDPDLPITAGYEGVVIEHEVDHVVVEVGPWDENGEPLVIVGCAHDCVEKISQTLEESARLRINQRWEDMERWLKQRERTR